MRLETGRSLRLLGLALATGIVAGLLWCFARTGPLDDVQVPPSALPAKPDAALGSAAKPPVHVDRARPAGRPARVAAPSLEDEAPETTEEAIRLRVLDAEDRAIAGAQVTLLEEPGSPSRTTHADGGARLPVAPTDEGSVKLLIEAEGYFHVKAFYSRWPELTVRLRRTVPLSGRVVDAESGAPIPDARIGLVHRYCKRCEPEVVTAGADGTYSIGAAPVGDDVQLFASAPGYAEELFTLGTSRHDLALQHDIELLRGVLVTGRVVDLITRAPIAEVDIQDADRGTKLAQTDATGHFELRALPGRRDGMLNLRMRAPGHCMLELELDPARLGPALEVPFVRGAVVEGVVLGADGAPVPDAQVGFRADLQFISRRHEAGKQTDTPLDELPEGARLREEDWHTGIRTDEAGRFRSIGLVPWAPSLRVSVSHPAQYELSHVVAPVPGAGETAQLELHMARKPVGGRVVGRLTLNGEAIGGRVTWQGGSRRGGAQAAADGAFVLEDVEPGEVRLWAGPRRERSADGVQITEYGFVFEGAAHRLLVPRDMEVTHDLPLKLAHADVAGRVSWSDGSPVVGQYVTVAGHPKGFGASVRTDEAGRYRASVPADGTLYRVALNHAEDVLLREHLPAGTEGVDFVLNAIGELHLRVVDAETGEPVQHCVFAFRPAGAEEFHSLGQPWGEPAHADGGFRFELAVGTGELQVRHDEAGYAPTLLRDVRVPSPPAVGRVEVELEPGLEIRLHLAEGSERPTDDVTVLLLEADAWEGARHWTDEGGGSYWDGGDAYPNLTVFCRAASFDDVGEAVIRGLRPGALRFKVLPPELVVEPERIDFAGNAAPVQVLFRRPQ